MRVHFVVPLVTIYPDGLTVWTCVECGRPTYYWAKAKQWKHHVRIWLGRRGR